MRRTIQLITLDLVKLDQENVRFGGDIAQNQREAIELLMADPEDARKILRLAEHIAKNGLDPTELQLVTPDTDGSGGYVVLEGNRRLTAMKLLLKPDLCPDERLVKSFIALNATHSQQLPTDVEFSVVESREAGDLWIELKHTGQNNGVGRVNWDSDIRDERRARQTGIESVGRQIRNMIRDNPKFFSTCTISDVFSIPVTTLTRLFSSKRAQTAFQIKIISHLIHPSLPLQFIAPSLEFAISLFKNEGYNVNDIRGDSERETFLSHLPPELAPLKLEQKSQKELPDVSSENKGENDTKEPKSAEGARNDDGTEVGKNTANEDQNSGSQETINKPRAKPSSRARKFLCKRRVTR
ncbi:ParB/Srx family N-terminal domain-containing protein [Brenneria uluponensis]|uniref:ParB/Srx family N-terminal domain-containing protein n=1 Tax=Brenneria uluponensis TaxID=3057057 RepID=UPI0028E74AA8|nr:ParB/Srx family N-terminal domain-containing protein [Brenneria ulupoensis]